MLRHTLLLIAVGITISVVPATPQSGKKPPVKKAVKAQAPPEWMIARKGRLGIVVDLDAVENDSIGATVASVTPGGPAAAAGIRAGDIIVRLNGKKLVIHEDEKPEPQEDGKKGMARSTAGLRLVQLAAKLDPGSKAEIEYRRGKQTRTVTVVTTSEPLGMVIDFTPQLFEMPGQPPIKGRVMYGGKPGIKFDELRVAPKVFIHRGDPEAGATIWLKAIGPLAEIELAPMNEDLGEYFGTSEGVLVLSAPKGNEYQLKGGDVILSIGDEKVSEPVAVFKLLHVSKGAKTKIEIMRNKERQTLTVRSQTEKEGESFELKRESK